MATIRVRHLVQQANGAFYFQATKAMRAAGMVSEALGRDPIAAAARADQLNKQWDEIRAEKRQAPTQNAPAVGTLDWLVKELKAPGNLEWEEKGERTKEEIDRALAELQPVFGRFHMNAVTPDMVIRFHDKLRKKASLHKTALIMKWWRYFYGYGLRRWPRIVTHNPTLAVRIRKPKARRQIWAPAWIGKAIRRAWRRKWYGVAVTLAIAYDTGLRPQDIRAVTPRQIRPDRITLAPQKTDHLEGRDDPRDFPIWPETFALIERYRRRLGVILPPDLPLIRSVSGQPFNSRHHLAKQVRIVLGEAGVPEDVQLRDLRRTGNAEAVLGGASAPQLAARLDHSIGSSQKILDTYTPASFAAAQAAQAARRKNTPGTE